MTPTELEERKALIEVAVLMIIADGRIEDDEIDQLVSTVSSHPRFRGVRLEDLADAISHALQQLKLHGLHDYLQNLAKQLEHCELRLLAFALATQISLADGNLADSEMDLLRAFQAALMLTDHQVAKIMGAIAEKNDLTAIVDDLYETCSAARLNHTDAYIETMLVMAAADGEVQPEECTQIALNLAHHQAFSKLDESEIGDLLESALGRIRADGIPFRLRVLAKSLLARDDRLQALSFAYTILAADNIMTPGESICLQQMCAAFALSQDDLKGVLRQLAPKPTE